MNFFLRWFDQKLRAARMRDFDDGDKILLRDDRPRRTHVTARNALSFKVINAIGGSIVEVNRVDDGPQYHDERTTLYIVPDDLDFQDELGKIITLEHMK